MDRRALIIGYALVAAGAALFASKAIFIKLAYEERYDALLILAWRMVFALPVFVVVGAIEIARRKAEGRPMPRRGAVLGAIGIGLIGYYLAMILDFGGLLYVTAQLLSHDEKRFRLFTTTHRADDDSVVSTSEHMLLHVDTRIDKACPADPAIVARLAEIARVHDRLPHPPQAGRSVGMKK